MGLQCGAATTSQLHDYKTKGAYLWPKIIKTVPKGEITKREVEIVELDERLDMSIDPLAAYFDLNISCPSNTNCAGANCVAGCS